MFNDDSFSYQLGHAQALAISMHPKERPVRKL